MEIYKNMSYTVRPDGRLMKKINVNGKPKYIYAKKPADLYSQFIELSFSNLKGSAINECRFEDYIKRWLKINSSGKSEATIKEYHYIANKYLIPYFGIMKLNHIKRFDIQQLQADLLENNHVELAHKCIRFMKTILNDAIANDFLIKNPCLNIKEPPIIHKEKRILTKEQDKLLLESTHKYARFFRILRYTGMRREEITTLTLDDIDLKNRTISINKAASFASNQAKIKETKNKKTRVIPILDVVYDDFVKQIELCKENKINLLFTKPTRPKEMLSQESIRCMTKTFCKDIGFDFNPHELRHSFCTMLYYSGIKIKEAQALMGHSSAKMIYDLYAHLDAQKNDVSTALNKYISCI